MDTNINGDTLVIVQSTTTKTQIVNEGTLVGYDDQETESRICPQFMVTRDHVQNSANLYRKRVLVIADSEPALQQSRCCLVVVLSDRSGTRVCTDSTLIKDVESEN